LKSNFLVAVAFSALNAIPVSELAYLLEDFSTSMPPVVALSWAESAAPSGMCR